MKMHSHTKLIKLIFATLSFLITNGAIGMAQPAPPPGQYPPPPGMQAPPPESEQTPPPPLNPGLPPAVGSPATPPPTPEGWGYPGYLNNPPATGFNQGAINVMATGYDTESVLVQIPLVVSYNFNGAYYDVTVLNCWNPYTQTWNVGIDQPAYTTTYYFNGFTYNYYVNLPTGTFYFNL